MTTNLDPQPWVYPDGYRTVSIDDGWAGEPEFSPRPGYSQDEADYR